MTLRDFKKDSLLSRDDVMTHLQRTILILMTRCTTFNANDARPNLTRSYGLQDVCDQTTTNVSGSHTTNVRLGGKDSLVPQEERTQVVT